MRAARRASNLKLLCRKHPCSNLFWCGPDGWHDEQLPDGIVVWTSPSGRSYPRHSRQPTVRPPGRSLWRGDGARSSDRGAMPRQQPRRGSAIPGAGGRRHHNAAALPGRLSQAVRQRSRTNQMGEHRVGSLSRLAREITPARSPHCCCPEWAMLLQQRSIQQRVDPHRFSSHQRHQRR